ncbi:MAG: hypothetical protein IPK80_06090 [Nannocystis sp.]|nr:hypothetical protein [Nannocystis sp.]
MDAVWLLMLARALAFARQLRHVIRLSALACLIASIALPAPIPAEIDASEERSDPKVEPEKDTPPAPLLEHPLTPPHHLRLVLSARRLARHADTGATHTQRRALQRRARGPPARA